MGTGLFLPLNGFFYDASVRMLQNGSANGVAIVQVADDTPALNWQTVADQLLRLGATSVAFDRIPDAPVGSGLISGVAAVPGVGGWSPLSSGAYEGRAVSIIPPAQYGIYRTEETLVEINGKRVPTLEAAVAGADDPRPFYVRFPGGLEGIPRIGLTDLIEGRVPAALVEGRAIIIGREVVGEGLATPLTPNLATISPLEYRAFALETLLSGDVPRALPPVWAGLLVLLAAAGGILLFRRTTPRQSLIVVVAVTAGVLVTGVAALFIADSLLPVAELLASQGLLSLMIWRRNETLQDRNLGGIARGTIDLAATNVPDRIATLEGATAVLGLEGSLVFSLSTDGRPRVVMGANLEAGDLPTELREGRHAAFADAVRENGPVAVDGTGRPLFVAPLRQSGVLAGYWVLAPSAAAADRLAALKPAINAFAPALAAVASTEESKVQVSAEKRVDQALRASLAELRERMVVFEAILDEASSAVELRDLLGRPVVSSRRFRAFAEEAGADPTAADPVALVGGIAGIDGSEAARMLRFVIVERGVISVPARRVSLADAVVRLSSLAVPGDDAVGYVLIEIVNLYEATKTAEAQRLLNEQLEFVLRNDLEAVQLAAALLERSDLAPEKRARAAGAMRSAVARTRERLLALEPFMAPGRDYDAEQVSPVELDAILRQAAQEARRLGGAVELDMPGIMPAAVAQPERLQSLVRSVLKLLGGDRGAALTSVLVFEEANCIRVEFLGPDLGLSDQQLRAYIDGSRQAESAEMRDIVAAAQSLTTWGGGLEVGAGQGRALRFVLTLRKLV